MAVRVFPGLAGNGSVTRGSAILGSTTGQKMIYQVPANAQAAVTFVSVVPTAGAATIQIAFRQSGVDTIVWQGTTAVQLNCRINLAPSDAVRIVVSVLDAASVFDALITSEEYSVV